MGSQRFNSWDADPARRTPQQWMVGHYLTLVCDPLVEGGEDTVATLQQLRDARFVESSAEQYLTGLANVLEEHLHDAATLPPALPEVPLTYVAWGSGIVGTAATHMTTSLTELHAAMAAEAQTGQWRMVGSLLCPEGIFEYYLEDSIDMLRLGDARGVYVNGVWHPITDEAPATRWFYYELLRHLQRATTLRPARWELTARLMAERLSKDMGTRVLLPMQHFTMHSAEETMTPTSPSKTAAAAPAKYVALLAGGPKDRYRELRPKLRDLYDIELRYHWEWHRPNQFRRPLPQDVNLALILYDMIGHAESEKLEEKAKTAGVRSILIPRKTCEIRATLEREGLVPRPGVVPLANLGATVIPLRPEQITEPPPKVRTKPRHPKATPPAAPPAPALPTTLQFNHGRGKIVVDCEVLELWLDERTTAGGETLASEIYQDYCAWCRANGATPYHNTVFSQWLERRGFARRNRHQRGKQVVMRALRLKPTAPVVAPLPVQSTGATPPRKSGPDYDALELFLLERCRTDAGSIGTMLLYSAFSSWCLQHKCRVMTPHAMEKHLHRMKLQAGERLWRVTLLPSEAAAPPTPAPTAVAIPGVSNADLRAQVLAKLTEVQSQLAAAGIREVVLTPTDLNIKR